MSVLTPLGTDLHPSFQESAEGKVTGVLLEPQMYALLLAKANVLDARAWPPEFRQGAEYLSRIREIEAECIATCGEWDFDRLSDELQDEYDSAIVCLEMLVEPEPSVTLEEARASRRDRFGP